MQTTIRHRLEATVTGTGVPAALRTLMYLYGMSGTDIAFALGRDRTMISAYLNGHKDMPSDVTRRLVELLQSCLAETKKLPTSSDAEDELLDGIMARTEELIDGL